jgi:E3 ubiquitin-protein ligase SHPRH
MRTFAVMKKEIKQCRLYWSALYDAALGRDELDQCKSRVRLRFPDEEVEEWEAHMKIHDYEVRPSKIKFEAEKATYEADMRQHLSQLAYLEGLSKKSRSLQPTAEKSMCPICQENIKEEVVVWACGHEVCPPCMLALLERAKHKQTVKCPSCRGRMNVNEVTYVKKADAIAFASNVNGAERQEHEGDKANQPEQPREVNGAQHVEVKGSWGSKIESVLLTLLKLFDEDPLAKVLLFSSWNDVLMVRFAVCGRVLHLR